MDGAQPLQQPAQAAPAVWVTLYDNERCNTPTKAGKLSWAKLRDLLQKRDIRPDKSGHAFALHRLQAGATRSNANVETITGLVGDIDGNCDLEQLADCLQGTRHIFYSTHSHDPTAGRSKFRIVVPLSKSISPRDYGSVWTGFNAMLSNILDPATKDPSRIFYLPSCPAAMTQHAVFMDRDGDALDPETLALKASNKSPALALIDNSDLAGTSKSNPPPETILEIERARAMLAAIPATCEYPIWRDLLWAIASTGWTCARDLAMQWSASAPDRFSETEFDKVWRSYNPSLCNGIGFGTLIHHARACGWSESASTDDPASSGDIKNGQLFAAQWRSKLLHIHETGDWLSYNESSGWTHAEPGAVDRAGKEVISLLRAHVAEQWQKAPDDTRTKRLMAHVERSSTEPKLRAMIVLAKSEHGMTVRFSELDADPSLLGVRNGVLDLTRGQLLPTSPALLVSKRCQAAFDPIAEAPAWTAFIDRVTRGKPEVARFLQRLAGYLLTGDTREQCFVFLHGLGANGKTTFAETLRYLLGDYTVVLPTSALMVSRRDAGAPSPDLMLLKGARLALAAETEEGSRLAEAQLKALTGGDAITARNPYGQFTTWQPTHKIIIVGNHRPVIAGSDHGIWRRVCLVPFEETIPDAERDPDLTRKLRAESPGILNWALAGLYEWQQSGLRPPAQVRAAADDYRADMDIIGQWLTEHTEPAPEGREPTARLYSAYQTWARVTGWNPMTAQRFGRKLAERGITLIKSGGNKYASGVQLNDRGNRAAGSA
jgi:putative DNA primase/helicase